MKTSFKKLSLLTLAVLFLSVWNSFAQDKFGGLALYTLRDQMATNPKETLKEVADIGYKYIEAAGYQDGKFYGMEPAEFKAYLDEIGLIPLSTHQGSVTLENADEMIKDVKAAGFEYFVIPVPPMGYFTYDQEKQTMGMKDDLEFLTEAFNTIGEKCKAAGLKLLYHNHNFEFKENSKGVVPYVYFLEHTNPEFVNFQMDLYWTTKADEDALKYFKEYPGRFKLWHVKDMDEQGRFAPVGTGVIDFERIFAHYKEAGLQHFIVEQDKTFNHTPLEAIEISHENLEKMELSGAQ